MSYSGPVFDGPTLDEQVKWIKHYQIDSLKLGRMCEQYPGLQKSWEQFKIVYELCKSEDEINRQDT